MASPNVLSLDDLALYTDGRSPQVVRVRGFEDDRVDIELPDGSRRRTAFANLQRCRKFHNGGVIPGSGDSQTVPVLLDQGCVFTPLQLKRIDRRAAQASLGRLVIDSEERAHIDPPPEAA